MLNKLLIIILALLFASSSWATDFITESWDTGTPTGCWPCQETYCVTSFNGWTTDYGAVTEGAGLSSVQKYDGTYSYYMPKLSGENGGCPITKEISGSPTTIYVRYYMLMTGSGWTDYANYSGASDPILHFIFTNSQQSNTGFRLNLVPNSHWGDCPAGDLCLLPEGDGGLEWWETRASPTWASTSENDYLQYVGTWTCFEYKMEISGSNVILTEYINGTQKRSSTGPGQNIAYFDKIIFHLWDNPALSISMAYYLDNIQVSDTYIGCGDTPTPTPTTTANLNGAGCNGAMLRK